MYLQYLPLFCILTLSLQTDLSFLHKENPLSIFFLSYRYTLFLFPLEKF